MNKKILKIFMCFCIAFIMLALTANKSNFVRAADDDYSAEVNGTKYK